MSLGKSQEACERRTDMELEELLKTAAIHSNGIRLADGDKDDIVVYLGFRQEREKEKESKK